VQAAQFGDDGSGHGLDSFQRGLEGLARFGGHLTEARRTHHAALRRWLVHFHHNRAALFQGKFNQAFHR
jgi:hypothetical protein